MSDKQPTITSASLPKAPVITNAEIPMDESIVARPLMQPDFLNVKSKNPAMSVRWVNLKSGEGLRHSQMVASGFVNAVPADAIMPNGSALPTHLLRDGKVIFGDLILMKISRAQYDGALKYNEEQARLRMRKTTMAQHGRKTVAEVPAPPELLRKLQMFEPSLEETNKLIGDEGGQSG